MGEKGGSNVAYETQMDDKDRRKNMLQQQKQKQAENENDNLNRDFEDLQLRGGHWKAAFRAGAIPMLACLPKAASFISSAYPMAPFSPGRDVARSDYAARARSNAARGHSGPIGFKIPKEARRKGGGFESQEEPTSPKVSCIGQVKLKKKQVCKGAKERKGRVKEPAEPPSPGQEKMLKLKKLFSAKKLDQTENSSFPAETAEVNVNYPALSHIKTFSSFPAEEAEVNVNYPALSQIKRFSSFPAETAEVSINYPTLGQMKRFNSSHEPAALANVYMDSLPKDKNTKANEQINVMVAEVRPQGEINLWKRRSVAPPAALNVRRSEGLETRQPSTA